MHLLIDNLVKKNQEEIQKPDLPPAEVVQPVEKDRPEAPQIKGPVEVPERKKEEEVQLDRPEAGEETRATPESLLDLDVFRLQNVLSVYPGVAVPEAEAHRHEPPIPHDKVMVDKRKNNAELAEDNQQPERDEIHGLDHAVKVENQPAEMGQEKPKPLDGSKKEDVNLDGHKDLPNEVMDHQAEGADKDSDTPPLKEAEKLDPVKEPLAGKAAEDAKQAGVVQAEIVDKAPEYAGKREFLLLFLLQCNLYMMLDAKVQY